mmetsp:Transcript_57309/g.107462  ORF Transcript_57309/g.107462 Transcript_57309/m.107462 type:complete len:101 (+) Transcript_57309:64-366(+)
MFKRLGASRSDLRRVRFAADVPGRIPPKVRFCQKAYCPECGKRTDEGEEDEMREACIRMWRKYMQLDDQHCPLFRLCVVKTLPGDVPSLWQPMPRIKGRS